jgi:zinc and cadmium transporter
MIKGRAKEIARISGVPAVAVVRCPRWRTRRKRTDNSGRHRSTIISAVSALISAVSLSLAGSLGGLLCASLLLLLPASRRNRLVPWLVSYAVGALLGVALMALLPEALELKSAPHVFGTLLAGILGFFVLEKAVLWRHCHTDSCEVHGVSASLVLVGGAFHNFVDGAMIGAAVLTSVPLGISTAAAVAAHEVPQEIGDFAVLLHAGYSRGKALALNILSGMASVAGAVVSVLLVDVLPGMLPYLLAVAAASFLYVAMSDLIPDLHNRGPSGTIAVRQVVLIGAGMATVLLL